MVKPVELKTKCLITQVLVGVIDNGANKRATPGARWINRAGKEAYYKVCRVVHNGVLKYYGSYICEDGSTVYKKSI